MISMCPFGNGKSDCRNSFVSVQYGEEGDENPITKFWMGHHNKYNIHMTQQNIWSTVVWLKL